MPSIATLSTVVADGPFDTIIDLPVHPLVVHAVVVLLPLSALALIAIVLVKRWRGAFGWVTLAGLAIATGAAFVAKESGEALAERVGLPADHASLGDKLPLFASLTLLIAIGWFILQRREAARPSGDGHQSIALTIVGIATVIMALISIVMTVLVGHSGSVAVWAGRIAATSPGGTVNAGGPSTASGSTITMTDVRAHSVPADCWSVVDGTVYDLTDWIGKHPGGPERIEQMCGVDATAAFDDEHGGEGRPTEELAQYEIGPLATVSSAAGPS